MLLQCPSLIEFFGYTFCFGHLLSGPFTEFKDYKDYIERKGVRMISFCHEKSALDMEQNIAIENPSFSQGIARRRRFPCTFCDFWILLSRRFLFFRCL